MKTTCITALLIFATFAIFSQISRKPVVEVEWNAVYDKKDTSKFYITKIDTFIFKELLSKYPKIAIEMWQPWCGSAELSMPKVNAMRNMLEQKGYHYILVSDNPTEIDYFKLSENGKVGLIIYFFNKYKVHFPTYIVKKDEMLKSYMQIVDNFIPSKKKKEYPCYIIENKKVIYKGYPYYFYKKYLK